MGEFNKGDFRGVAIDAAFDFGIAAKGHAAGKELEFLFVKFFFAVGLAIVVATESFGLRDKDHIFEDLFNAILQTTVSFDSQGFYGDVIEWSISADYSYDAVISSCPTAYVEENFPEEKSKYLKRPTYEERVRYAHSCSFGSIRISDVFFELRPENIWGYADEQLGLE